MILRPSVPMLTGPIEAFEPRVLLSALADFRGIAEGASYYPADLVYLAEHVRAAELPNLDRLQGSLRDLLGRQLRNLHTTGEASLGELSKQKINGTPWTAGFLADGDQPHIQVFVKSVAGARGYLEQLGMRILNTVDDPAWQVIGGTVPVSALRKLVNAPGLLSVMSAERPTVDAQGAAVNQWEVLSGADQFRRISPTNNGSGIDVGVISDSINRVAPGLAGSQASGDLPMSLVVLGADGPAGSIDEGRAMLELIHDVSPGAQLYFRAGGDSMATADAYTALKDAGVDVIADDLAYLGDPVFQQGVLSKRAEEMSVDHNVLVFGSSGNRNNETLATAWTNADGDRYHEFAAGDETLNITVPGGGVFNAALHWDQPWGGATTDIDIELWNVTDTMLLLDSNGPNTGGGNPVEIFSFTNPNPNPVSYVIRFNVANGTGDGAAAAGLRLQAYFRGASTFFTENYCQNQPGINPNRNSDFTFAIGAADQATPNLIESFSSRGPITRYFADDGTLLASPITKQQPLFHAADGVATTLAPNSGLNPFYGTSAATPNAAAIAAMALDAAGNLGRGDLTYAEAFELFMDTAEGVNAGTGSWINTAGFGRINGLVGPLVAAGRTFAQSLELNQFGNVALPADILTNTDVDGYQWSSNVAGSTTVTASMPSISLFAGMTLWDPGLDLFLDYDYTSGPAGASQINLAATADKRYQADVFARNQIMPGGGYDYTQTVDAPDQSAVSTSLDLRGDATVNDSLILNTDVNYYRVTSPANALGALTVQLTPSAGLNGVVSVYDATGSLLSRSDSAGAAGSEAINIANGIAPGAEFVIRVGASDYASLGSFSMSINFTALPAGLPLVWTDPGEGVFVPDRYGVFGDEYGTISPNAFMDAPGDRDSWYFGLNSGNSGAMQFNVTATIDSPATNPVRPIVAVYEADTGVRVGVSPEGNFTTTGVSSTSAVFGRRYVAVLVDEEGTRVGDVRLLGAVGSMTSTTTLISLNPNGDGSISLPSPAPAILAGGEVRRYRFVLPGGANGNGTITFDAGAGDGEIWVYGQTGTTYELIGFSRSAGPGSPEVLNLSGVGVGGTYEITVLPQNYESNIESGTLSLNFEAITGTAMGKMFRDDNRNGVQNGTEPGLEGFRVYFDEDESGTFSTLESSTLTAADGTYTLTGLRIEQGPLGARIRVVQQPGYSLISPASGSYYPFIPAANPTVTGLNFGNYRQLDFGDAPDTYKTSLAADGPRHWSQPGFVLGNGWDSELDGVPSAAALGDDSAGDDEDGVAIAVPLIPGTTGRFTVTAPQGGTLDAWLDFNRNGVFDSGERVATALALVAGANSIDVPVPAGMPPGDVFTRFRLSAGGVADPFGFGDVGEVEDYRFGIGTPPPPPTQPDLAPASDLGFSSNDNITADNSPTFTGMSSPGVLVRLFRDAVEVASATANGAGAWTITDPGPAPEGVRSYTATADAGSGQSPGSTALAVTIDTTPPAIGLSSLLIDAPVLTFGILFGENVGPSIQPADFSFFNVTDSASIPPGQLLPMYDSMINAVRISFPGASSASGAGIVPDGNYNLSISAGRITDLAGAGNLAFLTTFYVLAADANRDRAVNLDDFTALAANFGLTGRVFSQGNFNYSPDGAVNLDDFTILASQFGKSLAAPGALPPGSLPNSTAVRESRLLAQFGMPFASSRLIDELLPN